MKYILTAIVITLFLLIAESGPFLMLGMSHNDMDGMSSMARCPFMTGTESICDMNAMLHLSIWKTLFTSLPAGTFASVFEIALIALAFFSFVGALHVFEKQYRRPRKKHIPTFASLYLPSVISPRAP